MNKITSKSKIAKLAKHSTIREVGAELHNGKTIEKLPAIPDEFIAWKLCDGSIDLFMNNKIYNIKEV